jgi:hypothetical protein
MATTTNYGWAEPDNTSLVKNGAQDIRILGDAIDASVWNSGYGQAGKNKIINGDFGIWQRGASFNPAGVGFFLFADRWRSYTYAASATTATRESFTAGTAPVAGYEGTFFGRVVSTNTFAYFSYNGIENVRTFAGQTVTLSYWAKSASAQTLNEVQVSQYFGSTGSAAVATTLTAPSITTSWVRYTHTFAMPSISGKTISGGNDGIFINIKGAINNALDMWGFQLEYGSKATPFQTASGGSPQAELAMCQRYYYPLAITNIDASLTVNRTSTTTSETMIYLPTPMRTVPTISSVAVGGVFGRLVGYDTAFGVTVVNVTAVGLSACFNSQALTLGFTNAALTYAQGAASCSFDNQNVASTIAFSAEL